MKQEYINEQNGLRYTLAQDGCYYPLFDKEIENYTIGKYGRMRKRYLEEFHAAIYNYLLLSNKLNEHLHDVDVKTEKLITEVINSMAKADNCNNEMKMKDQLKWVGLMNNYHACAEEIIFKEIVYR